MCWQILLLRLAENVIEHGISNGPSYRAARELLLRRPPRLGSGQFAALAGETPSRFAVRIAADLDDTVLAIQGPPGAGKTYTGARMVCELVRRGARVGITAVSHKVIRHLLESIIDAADDAKLGINCAQKVSKRGEAPSRIEEITTNDAALARLADGRTDVVGATSWLWAKPEAMNAVDVLFVDEAGQMSLANVLAVSQAAQSLVLLGDPQQLDQPLQGSHPDGADVSALQHMLGEHKTILPDRGVFLEETWRLAPSICQFTSEVFYEGRLASRAGLDKQVLLGTDHFEGTGLWVSPVRHEGN